MLRTRHQPIAIPSFVTLTVLAQLLLLQRLQPAYPDTDSATRPRVAVDPTGDWSVRRRLEQIDHMVAVVLASNLDSVSRAMPSSRQETSDTATIRAAGSSPVGDPEEQFFAKRWPADWAFSSAIATRRIRLFPSPIDADGWSDDLLVEVPTSSLAAAVVSPPAASAIPNPVGSTHLSINVPWEFEFLLPISKHERWPFSSTMDEDTPGDIVGVEIPF